jgi:hypothetical protein
MIIIDKHVRELMLTYLARPSTFVLEASWMQGSAYDDP